MLKLYGTAFFKKYYKSSDATLMYKSNEGTLYYNNFYNNLIFKRMPRTIEDRVTENVKSEVVKELLLEFKKLIPEKIWMISLKNL